MAWRKVYLRKKHVSKNIKNQDNEKTNKIDINFEKKMAKDKEESI